MAQNLLARRRPAHLLLLLRRVLRPGLVGFTSAAPFFAANLVQIQTFCSEMAKSFAPHPMAKRCSRCLPLVVATALLWPCALIASPTNSAWRNRVAIRRGRAVRLAQNAIGLLVPSVRTTNDFWDTCGRSPVMNKMNRRGRVPFPASCSRQRNTLRVKEPEPFENYGGKRVGPCHPCSSAGHVTHAACGQVRDLRALCQKRGLSSKGNKVACFGSQISAG